MSSTAERTTTESDDEADYDYDDDDNSFERTVAVVVPTLFGVIVLTGFVGNLVVVLAVSLYRRARASTSLLMLNLAVADLVFIIVCVPTTAARYALPVWPLGAAWCKVSSGACPGIFIAGGAGPKGRRPRPGCGVLGEGQQPIPTS